MRTNCIKRRAPNIQFVGTRIFRCALYILSNRLIPCKHGSVIFRTEIRVQFRHVPGNLYKRSFGTDLDQATNELVIRVQPDEAIYLKINNKIPGLGMRLDRSHLNLHYAARY